MHTYINIYIVHTHTHTTGFPDGSDGKESACNAGHLGSIPGSGISPREGNGYPLQYSCLENSMDRKVRSLKNHFILMIPYLQSMAHHSYVKWLGSFSSASVEFKAGRIGRECLLYLYLTVIPVYI